jgi:hypothetical protein
LGVGKTTLVNVFREFLKKFRQGFLVNTASVISDSYCATGCLDTYISNKNGYTGKPVDLCIDELGREQIPAMHFGSKLNVMQYVLHQRYSLWQSGTALTHVTTNLTASDVLSRYDDFIFDRCRQMFNIINISGHSKR